MFIFYLIFLLYLYGLSNNESKLKWRVNKTGKKALGMELPGRELPGRELPGTKKTVEG
jgi:hypothetical protein